MTSYIAWILICLLFAVASPAAAIGPAVAWNVSIPGDGAAPLGFFPRQLAAVDTAGNAYVAGTTFNGHGHDYFVVKLDASGAQVWRAQLDAAGADDHAAALAIDDLGNVYVTGYSHADNGTVNGLDQGFIVKLDNSGLEQWRVLDDSPYQQAMAVDSAGNVYTASDETFRTVKYDANGIEQWRTAGDPKAGITGGIPYAIALGPDGSVYTTGQGGGPNGLVAFTVKYDGNGVEQWRATAAGPSPNHNANAAYALAIDPMGNVYVTGALADANDRANYATIKYDGNGIEQWRALANGPGTGNAFAYAIAVDAFGNVYVTGGASSLVAQARDFLTLKYSPNGLEQWRVSTNGAANGDDVAYALAADSAGTVLVTGTSFNGNNYDGLTVRYSGSGAEKWRLLGPDEAPFDSGRAVVLGPAASVYIVGTSDMPGLEGQVTIEKLIPSNVTTTTLMSSLDPSVVGQSVTFTATVTGLSPTGTMDFSEDAEDLCMDVPVIKNKSTGLRTAACSTSSLSIGAHSISAVYSGDVDNAPSTSSPLQQLVTQPPPGVTLKSSLNPSAPKVSVTFTATLSGKAPTGTVTFDDGAKAVCSAVPLLGGGDNPAASCTTDALARGSHSITAHYSGDANNIAATSPVLMQNVKRSRH